MLRNKKYILFSVLLSLFIFTAFSFCAGNFEISKKIYASGDNILVSTDGGNSSTAYDIDGQAFRDLIASSSNNLYITIISDCELTSTLEIYAQTTLVTAGNRKISRSGDFALISNYGNLQIGEEGDDDYITFDGSNFPSSLIQNFASGNKKLIIYNSVWCGNGNQAPTHNSPGDYGALYNQGNAIINDIKIHHFSAKNGSAIYNTRTLNLYAGEIYSNISTVGGTVANIGTGADFTIGDSSKIVNKDNLRVKIYDNKSYGSSAGIFNGTLGSSEKMLIDDCEIYNNVAETSQNAVGGAIGNFANLTVNYVYAHNNLTKCAVQDEKAFSAGAGIYNAGDNTYSAICNIYDAKIENNSSKIYSTASYNQEITEQDSNIVSVGAGVANFGELNVYGVELKNNVSLQGSDLWMGSNQLANQKEKVTFDTENSVIEIDKLYLDSNECNFVFKNIDEQTDMTISNFDISSQIAGNSKIISLQNCENSQVLEILKNSNQIVGFDIENNDVYIKFLITFKTQIEGLAKFDETLTANLIEVKLNGNDADISDVINQNAGDTLVYEWYYYPTMLSPKQTLSTNKTYKVGVGLVGKVIYVTAKVEKDGYTSNCLQNAQTQPIEQKSLTAVWGSNSANWNSENNSFVFSGYTQNPTIINFGTEYSSYVTYTFKDGQGQSVESTRFVGSYVVFATVSIDDVKIDNNSFEFSISKKVVALPVIKNTFYILNYQMQTLEFDELDPMVNVVGEKATSVGDYIATFSLKDKDNYVWQNGTSYDIQIRWRISYPINLIVFVIIGILIVFIVIVVLIKVYIKKKKQKRIRSGVNTKAINDFNNK